MHNLYVYGELKKKTWKKHATYHTYGVLKYIHSSKRHPEQEFTNLIIPPLIL